MIRYNLVCAKGHEFESWFAGSAAYDKQASYVEDFIKKNGGEVEMQKWYFCHRPEFILKKLGQTWVKWRYKKP